MIGIGWARISEGRATQPTVISNPLSSQIPDRVKESHGHNY